MRRNFPENLSEIGEKNFFVDREKMKRVPVPRFIFWPRATVFRAYLHSAAKQPSLRFRNGLGWSLGNVLELIYIDLVEAQRSYFFNFIEQF